MFRSILLFLICLCLSTNSLAVYDPLYNYIVSIRDIEHVSNWIMENYPKNVKDKDTADKIANQLIFNSAAKNIPLDILIGLVSIESSFIQTATSREGAKGLLQVVPKWHRDKLKGRNLYEPEVGLDVGSVILKDCLVKSKNNLTKTFSCYAGYNEKKHKLQLRDYKLNILTKAASFRLSLRETATKPFMVAMSIY